MAVLNVKIVDILSSDHQKKEFSYRRYSSNLVNSLEMIKEIEENEISKETEQTQDENFESENLKVNKSKSLPERIPAFGLLMSIVSVVCYSFGSLTVKLVKDIHPIEILGFR